MMNRRTLQRSFDIFSDNVADKQTSISSSYAEVIDYDPFTYSAKVLILPYNTETTWLPIKTTYAGNNVGEITPLFKGQIVLVECMGEDQNNMVISHTRFNNSSQISPMIKGTQDKFGVINGTAVDPYTDKIYRDNNTLINYSPTNGITYNTKKNIKMVADKVINSVCPNQNNIGNIAINLPLNDDSTVNSVHSRLDDMNNKLAMLQAHVDALGHQLEEFGNLTHLLQLFVTKLGLRPKSVMILDKLFPALQGSQFLTKFNKAVTEMKAIEGFVRNYGSVIPEMNSSTSIISDKISVMESFIQKGMKYTSYNPSKLGNLPISTVIGRIGATQQVNDVINQGRKILNNIRNKTNIVSRFYNLIDKCYNRVTETAFFEDNQSHPNTKITSIESTNNITNNILASNNNDGGFFEPQETSGTSGRSINPFGGFA